MQNQKGGEKDAEPEGRLNRSGSSIALWGRLEVGESIDDGGFGSFADGHKRKSEDIGAQAGMGKHCLDAGWIAVDEGKAIEVTETAMGVECCVVVAYKDVVDELAHFGGEGVGNDRDEADGTKSKEGVGECVIAADYFKAVGCSSYDSVDLREVAACFFDGHNVETGFSNADGGFGSKVDASSAWNIIEHYGERRCISNGGIVLIEAFLRGFVVIRGDDEYSVESREISVFEIPANGVGIVLAKIVATGLTVGSGGSGGVFGPSLFIGGVLGAAFAGACELIAPDAIREPEMFILVGMAAFFAGAAKAPIAGVVMVCEMTGSYSLLPGLLIAAVMHIAFSRPWSIYKSQVQNKFASPAHRGDMDVDVLRVTAVGDVIEHCEMKTLRAEDSLGDVLKDIEVDYVYPVYEGTSRTPAGLSVAHEQTGNYIGLLDMSIVKNAYISSPDLIQHLLISDCTVKAPMLIDTMDLHSALNIFIRTSINELCVKNHKGEVIGVLSHSAIFKAYDKIVQQEIA